LKIVAALQFFGAVTIGTGVILVVVALFTIGWETAFAALVEGGLSLLTSFLGLTITGTAGIGAVALGASLTTMAIAMNMTVKEVYDNGYLLPTQQINALKEALAVQKGIAGFVPSLEKPKEVAPATRAGGAGVAAAPIVKVFTGIVSQGTLGENVTFTPRESDLISTMDELTTAAQNNIASFVQSLWGKLIYEIKVVNRIITKDGTVRIASTQRVVAGLTQKGVPKYKTVTNKFAEVIIYVLTEKSVRTKIASVVLGPVDATAFTPDINRLNTLAEDIKKNIVTSNIKEVGTIETTQPITIVQPAAPAAAPAAKELQHYFLYWPAAMSYFIDGVLVPSNVSRSDALFAARQRYPDIIDSGDSSAPAGAAGRTQAESAAKSAVAAAPAPAPTAPAAPSVAIPASNNPNKCAASTIAKFFDVNSLKYPTVAERGKLYEAFGLGPANWYTGSAEQNVKLLAELKTRSGC